jgi:hypothetical protein
MNIWRRVFGLAVTVALAAGWIAYGQDPLKLLPNNYKLVLDNADVAVIRAHYGGHEKIPVHDHTSFSTVFVYLSDSGPVRIDHAEPGEKPVSVMRPPTVKGSYRVAPGIVERHSIENLGDLSSDFLRVELKRVSLKIKEPFRGKAPKQTTSSVDAIEFSNPGVEVERIVCAGATPCPIKISSAPSLIVAFDALSLDGKPLEPGTARWMPAGQSASIVSSGGVPAHVLRILLPAASQ